MRGLLGVMTVLSVCGLLSQAHAVTYTFQPPDPELADLDHHWNARWGIDWVPPADETLVGATLRIDDLYDWTYEYGDVLYIHLLNDAPAGVDYFYDGQGGGDAFEGYPGGEILLDTYTDPLGGWATRIDYSYEFSPTEVETLDEFLANYNFGIGMDADCHYYNSGVYLDIETTLRPGPPVVPEPLTMVGVVSAMGGLGGYVRRRRRR